VASSATQASARATVPLYVAWFAGVKPPPSPRPARGA